MTVARRTPGPASANLQGRKTAGGRARRWSDAMGISSRAGVARVLRTRSRGLAGYRTTTRTLRGGRLMNSPAGPAAIARPADADNSKPRGHMIEHLADSLADHMQFTAAAGARLMLEIEPHVLAGQMRRQAW